MTETILPPRLTMYSSKASLKLVLSTLPLNSLAVIAAEILHNTGGPDPGPDRPEAAEDALESLYLDVLNAAAARVEDPDQFLQAVNWWYREPGADSRGWWQRVLGALAQKED